MFGGGDTISVRWFELEDTARAIGAFALHTIPAFPMETDQGSGCDVPLWPPPSALPPRYPRRLAAGPAGVEPAEPIEDAVADSEEVLDDVSGQEDEDGEQEEWVAELESMLDTMMGEDEADGAFFEQPPAGLREDGPPAVGAEPPARAAEEGPGPEAPPVDDGAPAERGQEAGANRIRPDGRKGGSEVTVVVPGGFVAFYANKQQFQATCDNPSHGSCKLTRTCRGSSAAPSAVPKGGRPVAFLAAWLANGEHVDSKAQHWDRALMNSSLEQRTRLRNMFKEVASGRQLLSYERPVAPNEPEEPVDLAPYMR